MGHRKPTLQRQVYNELATKYRAGKGTSKKAAIEDGTYKDKIFAENTYRTYYRHAMYFVKWCRANHPECRTLRSIRPFVNEWLQTRVNTGLSSWTIHTETAALSKLYGIDGTDPERFQVPRRERSDIKRSRGPATNDHHFSQENNKELIHFCRGTGCRRNILEKLEGRDLWTRKRMEYEVEFLERLSKRNKSETKDLNALRDALAVFKEEQYFLHHRGDKGGRSRYAPIIGEHKQEIIERMQHTRPGEKVWGRVNKNADIHSYRADYATEMYKQNAVDLDTIPYDGINAGTGHRYQTGVYVCKKDRAGTRFDRAAMRLCSKALGHNRINVVADNYLRGC